jgi:hypothetical protein
MKLSRATLILIVCAFVFSQITSATAAATPVTGDPYAPLQLYNGKWDIAPTAAGQELIHIENHCVKTGLFFACEQIVNGKSEALVVFPPLANSSTGSAQEYRMEALNADASPAGEWSKLIIDGDRWVYSWESMEDGKKISWRNTNTFTGTDHIHYEIQRLEGLNAWKTVKSGHENRVT